MTQTFSAITSLVGRKSFFYGVVGLFCVEALWIAVTGLYPMAFDEDFHLGIIRIYAHHINPFLAGQPSGADAFGAVARDPSYLYQYVMSFPYRLIAWFTADQTIQVISLRLINIVLFASSLPLFRRLLLQLRASAATVHACLLAFILIPIVPFLGAQINYDNLLLPLVALNLLLTMQIAHSMPRAKPLNVRAALKLISLLFITCLVKYAFLPIAIAIIGFLIVRAGQLFPSFKSFRRSLYRGWIQISSLWRWLLVVAAIGSAILFGQRYIINSIDYHTPVPDCNQVLTVEQCSHYGPWIRDYNNHLALVNGPKSPLVFTADWFYGMWLRTFFAVDGPLTNFETKGPLLLPAIAGMIVPVVALVAILWTTKKLFQGKDVPLLWLLVLSSGLYIAVLWLDEYKAFVHTGQPVAINGRYLLPVLLPLLVIATMAFNELFRRWPGARLIAATVAVVALAWGGGSLTYILRSQDDWYFPNQMVLDANHAVKTVIGPITPGYRTPNEFLP